MIMTNQMLLAAIQPDEQIYFITSKVDELDGVVVRGNEVVHVPFWSYINNNAGAVTRLKGNDFLNLLWDGGQAIKSDEWNEKFINRTNPFTKDDLKSVVSLLLDVPKERKPEVQQDLSGFDTKAVINLPSIRPGGRSGATRRLRTGARRGALALEPYDPDARDADGDGIVQEGTAWERPATARILDALGREIRRGQQASIRPTGIRVVDRDGNDIDYKPTYEGGRAGTIGGSTIPQVRPSVKPPEALTPEKPAKKAAAKKPAKPKKETPLADHGARSLKERGLPSAREQYRAATTPPEPEAPEVPEAPEPKTPKAKKPKETPVVDDIALSPGVTLASADRPELEKPEKPRSPFKPSPPPLEGRAQELADQADGDFKKFMELLDKEGYVVFDYETTGLQDGNIPVQIGAVRIKDGKIVERFNVFTNPQRPLSDWSKENLKDKDGNPLTDEWLQGQTDLAEAHRQMAEFLGDSIIVAHNLPYDGEIIDRMMKDADIDYKPSGSIDTLMLLRSAVPKGDGESGPERHTLGSLADFFDVDLGDAAHTADADSEAAALVLQKAMNWSGDNDSSPDIFDAAKQKELFDAATKKYNDDRKKYEEALKKYRADLADYERAVTRADEPEVERPEALKPDATANTPPPPRFDFGADSDRPPPRFDPDANANQARVDADEQVPKLEDLNGEDREWVQQQLEAVYMSGAERERATSGIVKEESIDDLERRIRFLELEEIPRLRRDANNKDYSKRDRAFAAEGLAIEEQRLAVYKAGVERKRELVPAKAPQVELTPEEMVKLEKDMAERYGNLRKKRGGIVGRWMVKTYGDGDPPPWETDKNIKIEELREMVTRKSPEDVMRIREWVKQVYAIDEVVGRNGLRFRVQLKDSDIQIKDSQIPFAGKVQAFNVDTNEWEDVGTVARNIDVRGGYVTNVQLMLGKSAGYDNPLGNKAKNEGFTSVFNPHAFTWLKASGFERADVTAASDGKFVWGRAGFRQEQGAVRGEDIARRLMEEVKKYRDGEEGGLIRTDLDADLIEYLTTVAKQKDFTIDAPQHPEYILALAGDKNLTESEKKAYDKQLQEWFTNNAPFGTGKFMFTDENVPDDPRKLL